MFEYFTQECQALQCFGFNMLPEVSTPEKKWGDWTCTLSRKSQALERSVQGFLTLTIFIWYIWWHFIHNDIMSALTWYSRITLFEKMQTVPESHFKRQFWKATTMLPLPTDRQPAAETTCSCKNFSAAPFIGLVCGASPQPCCWVRCFPKLTA